MRYLVFLLVLLFCSNAQAASTYVPSEAEEIATDTTNFDGTLSTADTDVQKALDTLDDAIAGAGSGDVTAVGDCATGACFNGTQGTTLTFNNAGGDATQVYDGTTMAFSKAIEMEGGNITYVDCGTSIATAVSAATAGDTLVLGSCTYTVSSAISIAKALNIVGQGPEKTILNNTGTDTATISVTADGFHLSQVGFTGSDVDQAIIVDCEAGTVCSDITIDGFKIVITGASDSTDGIRLQDSGADIRNGYINLTTSLSAANQSRAIFKRIQSTAEANTTVRVTNVRIESTSTGSSGSDLLRGVMSWNNGADESANSHYVYMRNVDVKLSPDSTVATEAFELQGARGTAYIFGGTLDGGTGGGSNVNNDIRVETGDVAYLYGTILANNRNNNQGTMTQSGVIQAAGIIGGQPQKPETTTSTALVGHSALSLTSGDGGDTTGSGTQTGGAAGAISLTGGVGGVANSANTASTGGAGSAVTITSGAGGTASTATGVNVGGAGGALSFIGGAGGATASGSSNTGGAGASLFIRGGAGGAGSTATGADGNVYLLSDSSFTNKGTVFINSSVASSTLAPLSSNVKLSIRNAGPSLAEIAGFSGTAASTGGLNLMRARGTQSAPTVVSSADDVGNINFYGYDGNSFESTASIQAEADGTVSDGVMPTRLSFFTGANASQTRRMTIDNLGNVALGTPTAPAAALEIYNSTSPYLRFSRNDTTATTGEKLGRLEFWNNDTQLTTQGIGAVIEANVEASFASDAAQTYLSFLTTSSTAGGSPTEAMRIDSASNMILGGRSTSAELRFLEPSGSGTNYTAFKAPAQAADITYTLPIDDGDAGEVLQTDGAGVLSWQPDATGAGGGDAITVNTTAATDANFLDGDIDWTLNAGSTPDDITATVACSGCIDATDMAADSVGESELIESMNFVATGGWDYGGATLEVPNSTSLPGTCTVGQVYMDTDATSGQRIYACESSNTWALQGGGGGGAPTTVDYLVGTADGTLSNEIVVGATPGGELGGTWASPTIDDSLAVTSWNLTTPTITTSATVTDDDWIGLGASAALIQFDDQATDEIEILNANVRIGAGSASYPPATKLEAVGSNPGSGIGTEDMLKLIRPTYALEYSKVAAFKLGKWDAGNLTSSSRLDIALKNGASGTYDADVTVMTLLSSTKVGIGTTAPDKSLEINNSSGGSLRLTYNDSNGSAATYSDMSVNSSGNLNIAPSGGEVGIGNDTPLYKLEVGDLSSGANTTFSAATGAVAVSDSGNSTKFIGENTGADGSSSGSFVALVQNDGTAVASTNRLGGMQFGGYDGVDRARLGAAVIAYADGTYSATSTPTYINFETAPSGSATRGTKLKIGSAVDDAVTINNVMTITPQAALPTTPVAGMLYVDSSPAPDELCFYDGTSWQGLSSGTDANCA